jgi:hypothetical protein
MVIISRGNFMSYSEIIFIILSLFAILICLFTIWLAIIFYRRYTQFSLIITEIAKGLDICTKRIERLPKVLYDQELILSKNPGPDNQTIEEKEKEREKDYNKEGNKGLSKNILPESEEI